MNESIDRRAFNSVVLRLMVRFGHLQRAVLTYPPEHPSRVIAVESVLQLFEDLVRFGEEATVQLAGDHLVSQGLSLRSVEGMSGVLQDMTEAFTVRGLGGFLVRATVNRPQLDALVAILQEEPDEQALGPEPYNRKLDRMGIQGLRLLGPRAGMDMVQQLANDPGFQSLRLYLRAVRAVARLQERGISPAMVMELRQIAEGTVSLVEATPVRAMSLATPRQVLPYTLRHPFHMALLSVGIALRLGFSREQRQELAVAAMVADIGMSAVPAPLRERADRLDDDERAQLQTHPTESAKELLRLPSLDRSLRRWLFVAMEHHIGLTGLGYPKPVLAQEAHPYSRIVCVADAYDALRANTGWRRGLSPEATIAALRAEAGVRFDPHLIDVLEQILRVWSDEAPEAASAPHG